MSTPSTAPQAVLTTLLAAREGTGVAFPGAVAAFVRERPHDAVAYATQEWAHAPAALTRVVALDVLAAAGALHGAGEAGAGDAGAGEAGAGAARAGEAGAGAVLAALAAQATRAARDEDADVRWAAAKALGACSSGAATGSVPTVAVLAALARDDDADVRWQAVSSLPLAAGSGEGEDDGEALRVAVAALVAATADADDDVADHAVFALGLQLDVDTAAVRDALAAHLGDAARGRPDTAAQAALALAQRGDARAEAAVHEALAQALAAGPDAVAELEDDWLAAARLLPAGRVAPLLQAVGAHTSRTRS